MWLLGLLDSSLGNPLLRGRLHFLLRFRLVIGLRLLGFERWLLRSLGCFLGTANASSDFYDVGYDCGFTLTEIHVDNGNIR